MREEDKAIILYWPDGFWCYKEDFEEFAQSKSDDYDEAIFNRAHFDPVEMEFEIDYYVCTQTGMI
jgi:hypothetical protein